MTTYPTRRDMMRPLVPGSVGAEIGVQAGVFAAELLSLGPRSLHLIDPWRHWPDDPDYDRDGANFAQEEHDRLHQHVQATLGGAPAVEIHRLTSAGAVGLFADASLDWVYIDARHTFGAVREDLEAWAPKIAEGGSICGHDYTDHDHARMLGFGVVRAVDEFCADHGWTLIATTAEYWPSYRLKRRAGA
jgi:hypothetical protein